MAMNGSGIRDTARVLQISPTTVIEELKKTALAGVRQLPVAGVHDNATDCGHGRACGGGRNE